MRKLYLDNPNKGLSFLYNNAAGRIILKPLVSSSLVSKIVGCFMSSFLSIPLIKPFIRKNNIDLTEYKDKKYTSFNDFFIRKRKDSYLNISMNKNDFISPCDCKLTVYKIDDNLTFNIKNTKYNISSLINDEKISKEYNNGYVLVFRLSPNDYHRYCFIDDGIVKKTYNIKGKFHTVSPIVYDKFSVFKENTRCVSIFNSKNFDKLLQIEVGALLVGKIKNYDLKKVKKATEKGYFMFGGSTIVIVVKENKVIIDNDILVNSEDGYETLIKYGEKIGKKYVK